MISLHTAVASTLTHALGSSCTFQRSTMCMLPAKPMSPTTVEVGMNPDLSELSSKGIVARYGTPQLPKEAEPETPGVLFATLAGSLSLLKSYFPVLYSLCPARFVGPLFPLLTPKNSDLTKLYLKALSSSLSLISEVWHPSKQPSSAPDSLHLPHEMHL